METRNSAYWMCTYSGVQYWPADPRVEDVRFEDISHALSIENRFGGHLPEPYSVAQHSWLASLIMRDFLGGSKYDQLCALFHDAPEAYLKDIPRPLKKSLPEYEKLTKLNEKVIAEKFGLTAPWSPLVKKADEICLTLERQFLFPTSHQQLWVLGGTEKDIPDMTLAYWDWRTAKSAFIGRYYELTNG